MVTLRNVHFSLIWTFFVFVWVAMARKWQRLLLNKPGLNRSKIPKHYPYKEPFLSKTADNDLAKQWVVDYSVWSEQREKLVRKRVVISGPTAESRKKDADEVIALLSKELKDGAYVEPLDQPEPSTSPIDLNPLTCRAILVRS